MPKENEDELALCLQAKARWGFGSTRDEVRDSVRDYVSANKGRDTKLGRYLKIHCQFKHNKPGEDWLISFMKRYRLSIKRPSKLEKTRKIAASDPEIIYSYLDLLVDEVKKLILSDRPECMLNLDETNVYRCQVYKDCRPSGREGSQK